MRSTNTLRHRKPHGPFRRCANGIHIPPAIAAQLETRRSLISEKFRAMQALKQAGGNIDIATRVRYEQCAKTARLRAAEIICDVRHALRKHNDERSKAEAS